jgi:hypothetical protein
MYDDRGGDYGNNFYEGGDNAQVIGNERQLRREILARSVSKVWETALPEWDIAGMTDGRAICLCGHDPIHEIFHIVNCKNGERGGIGNTCITKFMGRDVSGFADCLGRIRRDPTKALNKEAAEFCLGRRLINELEYDFTLATLRKRKLSPADDTLRRHINRNILAGLATAPVYDPEILARIVAAKLEVEARAAAEIQAARDAWNTARAAEIEARNAAEVIREAARVAEIEAWNAGAPARAAEAARRDAARAAELEAWRAAAPARAAKARADAEAYRQDRERQRRQAANDHLNNIRDRAVAKGNIRLAAINASKVAAINNTGNKTSAKPPRSKATARHPRWMS